MGARPRRKTVFVEHDWMWNTHNVQQYLIPALPFHTVPPPEVLDAITAAFQNAPVPNPDGSQGIDVIHDWGQGGLFTGGNNIGLFDIHTPLSGSTYATIKASHFSPDRQGIFHYCLHGCWSSTYSAQAETPGDDMLTAFSVGNPPALKANILMHALGHNLGLRHGGNINTEYKPNYNSVMNLRYLFSGVDTTGDAQGDGVLNFHTGPTSR